MENWRVIATIAILLLSIIDLSLTYTYVLKYKKWQPEKPFSLMENNPLLVYLWEIFGIHLGMFIGSVVILSLIYIVGTRAHPIVVGILFFFLAYALYNHSINIGLLDSLIKKYPTGHLPKEVFGEVVGSN